LKISKEIKVAVLVVSGILLFIYMFNYLKGEDILSKEDTYFTEFDYNALNKASLVTIKGNAVGKVKEINYNFDSGKTIVSFTVDPQLKFSKNSTIRLYETGIMSGNALAIIKADDTDFAKSGDYITSEIQLGLISNLKENFSGISTNLDRTLRSTDTLIVNLNKLVVDESGQGIKATIAELNSTLKAFKNLSYSIQNTIKSNDDKIADVLDNVNKASNNLVVLSDDLKKIEISNTIANLDKTLQSVNTILSSIENGEGSLGKMLKDEELYNNLVGASKEMEELLLDIKLHPKRYFRVLSKKEIPYKTEN
jgi:phospholipid/cholesterol/gamma-HCH transport system substrate-binding protein